MQTCAAPSVSPPVAAPLFCGSDGAQGFRRSQSGSEVVAGTQAVPAGLAVCLVDDAVLAAMLDAEHLRDLFAAAI